MGPAPSACPLIKEDFSSGAYRGMVVISSGRLFSDGCGFGFLKSRINSKEGTDARHFEQRDHLSVHPRKVQLPARLLRRDMCADQGAEARGVDKWNATKIKNHTGRGLRPQEVLELENGVKTQRAFHM